MATNNNKKLLNTKSWQMMRPLPIASGAAMQVIADNKSNLAMYVTSTSVQHLYHHDEDAWLQLPSAALAGAFGLGICGAFGRWSTTLTANGGSTTTVTTATAITGICIGRAIRFLTGANAGTETTITGALINISGNQTIQFAALPNPVVNTDTFTISTGQFYVLNAGTVAAGFFKSYDVLTGVWTSLSVTGLPATWGIDGKLIGEVSYQNQYVTGTSSGVNTTLTLNDTSKSWTVNNFNSYQLRITAGTGKGQIRNITANTSNQLTIATAWTTTPDSTSQYVVEANDDYLYLLGNAVVTMYRYQKSTNTWTTLLPTVARAGAPMVGMSADIVEKTGDVNWSNEANLQDGRYLYSLRGGATATLDRYDKSLNTWAVVNYPSAETFTSGTSTFFNGRYIYIKNPSGRFFKFSVRGNYLEPLTMNPYLEGAATVGNRIWIKDYDETNNIQWLYNVRQNGTELFRLLLI